jgi:hypothetical protein
MTWSFTEDDIEVAGRIMLLEFTEDLRKAGHRVSQRMTWSFTEDDTEWQG